MIAKLIKHKSILIGGAIICLFITVAVFAPLISPYSPTQMFEDALSLKPFSLSGHGTYHILGTDDLGRDILSRIIYGSRISLLVGFLVVLIAGTAGTLLGLISGFYGGLIDTIIMRCVDILMAFPSILLAIVVVAIAGPGTMNAVIAVAIVALPQFIRVTRASVLNEKSKDYVSAAFQYGARPSRIMFKEVFPNCVAPIIVQASLGFSDGILNVAALGFLGMGAQAPLPEWGMMLSDARPYITSAPWMVTIPGLCILIIVLSFNLLGDGLRDYLDPKLI
jgi:peptide/nickel transport system permease protein/dipeptide transport system permease protein